LPDWPASALDVSPAKNWTRYNKKCLFVFMQNNAYFCRILIKLEFSERIFEKYSNIKFHENPSSWSRDLTGGQTDRQTDEDT
jgi:hypothetical protein